MRTRMTDWLTGTDDSALALPPFLAPFAKKVSGSSGDEDDADEDDADEDDADEDDEDDDPDAGKTDEELRDELKAIRASLAKANGQSAARRKKLRERDAELEAERKKRTAKPAAKKAGGDEEAPDLDAIRDEVKREAKTEADTRIKRSEAKAALVAAGVSREVAADLIGFVKLDELDVEGDEVEGLDEEIERIKTKYPTFFVKGRRRRESVAGDGDRDGKAPRKKAMTASEKQAARLAG